MGIILYEMLIGVTPFNSCTVQELFKEITNRKYSVCLLAFFLWNFMQLYTDLLHNILLNVFLMSTMWCMPKCLLFKSHISAWFIYTILSA